MKAIPKLQFDDRVAGFVFLLACGIAAHAFEAAAAEAPIQIIASTHISRDTAAYPHVEPFLAVDPRDPKHLLATSMVFVDGQLRSFPYVSFDSGATWTRGKLLGDESITTGADPIIYFAPSGSAFYSTLPDVDSVPKSAIARSTDGGLTWRTVAVLPQADRQWLAFDPSRGPFSGRIYFTGTGTHPSRDGGRAISPFLARSDDDGLTFPMRSVLSYDRGGSDPAAALNAVPLEPLMTSGGLLILPLQGSPDPQVFEKYQRDSINSWAIGLMTSGDGGDSFGPARYAPTPYLSVAGTAGRRFRSNQAIGYVRSAIDATSGRYRNRIYFVSSDYDPALDRYVARVWITGDFGKSWKTSVASDAPRGDAGNPAIAVNRDGLVAVTWNDRRDDPGGRCWQLYASISADGGESFLPSLRLSRGQTCSNAPGNWSTFGAALTSNLSGQKLAHFQTGATVPMRFPNGGETQGLAADAAGVFHAAWIGGETGVMQLWYTAFRPAPGLVAGPEADARPEAGRTDASPKPPSGMLDVTDDVRFHILGTKLDFATHRWTVTLQIENRGGRPLRGPLLAVMTHFLDERHRGGGLENLAVENADSGGPGVGATWQFEVAEGVLAYEARTKLRDIRFSFDGGAPDVPEGGYLTPGFRIYARKY